MKKLIHKYLFRGHPIHQYSTFGLYDDQIEEKVFLRVGDQVIDVSKKHFVLGQVPYVIGVWLDHGVLTDQRKVSLEIQKHGKLLLRSNLTPHETFEFEKGKIVLLHLKRTQYKFIGWLHQKALIAYFYFNKQNKVSFHELDSFCAMYTYPRKVILTCFGTGEDYNVFPMDLQGFIPEGNLHILGLRNTNVTLRKMLDAKKVVICGIEAHYKEIIFKLGAHHSTQPPNINSLPFELMISDKFKFLIPRIVAGYKELEIINHVNKGTHTIMICKVVSERKILENSPSLHHIHIASLIKLENNYSQI